MSSHSLITGIYGHYFKSYHGVDNKADWQVTQVTAPKMETGGFKTCIQYTKTVAKQIP